MALRSREKHVRERVGKTAGKANLREDLVNWAIMLMINDAFFRKGDDAEMVIEWVNRISLDLMPED